MNISLGCVSHDFQGDASLRYNLILFLCLPCPAHPAMGPANEVVPGEEPERNNENGQVTEDAKPNGSSHAAPER